MTVCMAQGKSGEDTLKILERDVTSGFVIQTYSSGISKAEVRYVTKNVTSEDRGAYQYHYPSVELQSLAGTYISKLTIAMY